MSICVGVFHDDFRYFISSLIASSLPIMMAFYKLQWDNVTDIVGSVFKKKDDNKDLQIPEDQLKDP